MAASWDIPMQEDGHVLVTIPDLFKSFLAAEPIIRPDYEKCQDDTAQWLTERLAFDAKAAKKLILADFTYFVQTWVPGTPYERFRLANDWTNLFFYYDDLFDDGELKNDPVRAQATVDRLFAAIDGDFVPADPHDPTLDYVDRNQAAHDEFWQRLRALASPGQRRRYRRSMFNYFSGALRQVLDCENHFEYDRSLGDILERRRDSVGMEGVLSLLYFAFDLEIDDAVMEDPKMKEIEGLCTDLFVLQNDVASHRKEEAENVTHNMVATCRLNGMSAQEAYDHTGAMIDARLDRLDQCIAELPYVDDQVATYVQGMKNVLIANVHWSFRGQRYFGSRNAEVRRTRVIDVLADPEYLKQMRKVSNGNKDKNKRDSVLDDSPKLKAQALDAGEVGEPAQTGASEEELQLELEEAQVLEDLERAKLRVVRVKRKLVEFRRGRSQVCRS
ncbi:hypothetical protein AC579_1369 [Pseudocercospora musae]|uniref:Terpene synthase n=1 Tax=Pseudocercospora musae TaxID=113226 RepID=A0A139IKL5_9PEZI|nr:hypothetical protein AC579_1369 [Pseudocercospora musae]